MSAQNFLPPIPQPPHDPTSWLLNARAGWHEAKLTHKENIVIGQSLALELLPDNSRSLTESSGSFGGLTVPANVALGPDGSIYLLDTETLALKRFDPCECVFKTVPCFGGEGSGVRQLRNPHGIGICSGNLFICDTGNHRLSVFSLHGLVLRGHWDPSPDSNLANLWEPCGIAFDSRGRVFVSDGANGCIHRFSPTGRWETYLSGFGKVIGYDLRLMSVAAVDGLVSEGSNLVIVALIDANLHIRIFDASGKKVVDKAENELVNGETLTALKKRLNSVPDESGLSKKDKQKIIGDATSITGYTQLIYLTIDCRDRLYVIAEGVEHNLHIVDTDGKAIETTDRLEALMPLFPPPTFVVDPAGNLHLGPLCVKEETQKENCESGKSRPMPEPGVFDLHGNLVTSLTVPTLPAYYKQGFYYSQALDSELYRCQWHRILLRGEVPPGTHIEISTYTAEALFPNDDQVQNLPEDAWETKQIANEMPDGEWDCLIRNGGGRYLWLRLEFRGNGKVTPILESIVIEFPRISLRRYLPAVFGMEPVSADFTDRFLSLFDTSFRSIEETIDNQARYFDPLSAPIERDPKTGTDFLSWLASWIGLSLDRHWPEAKRRQFLKRAGKLYNLRGTRLGLWRQLLLLLDMEPDQNCCPGDQPKLRCRPISVNCPPDIKLPCAWQPPPLMLEHYQLRRWLFLGAGRLGDQALLWGKRIVNRFQLSEGAQVGHSQLKTTQDPYRDPFHVYAHKFTVFVPACYGQSEQQRKALENLLKAESPAHTHYQLEFVEPRFRIGFQSMIGFDAVIGRLPQGVTLNETPLGPASVLGSPPHKQGGPFLEIGKEARIGTTTILT
jgi:phage tail-like protein